MAKKNWTVLVLARAKELIQAGWTKGANARTAQGIVVKANDPDAVCYCANGAIERAQHELKVPLTQRGKAWVAYESAIPPGNHNQHASGVNFNDESTSSRRVVLAFGRALKAVA